MVLSEQDQDDENDEDDEDEEDDEDDEEMTPEEKKREEKQNKKAKQCTVLVELLQKDRRQKNKVHFLYIAFHIYRVRKSLAFQLSNLGFNTFILLETHTCLHVSSVLQVPPEASISWETH